MDGIKFGASEYNFPVWGALAFEMARDAGFDGIEITDGGGYLQPHPMNKGIFVECERFTPELVRLDGYPLNDESVQNEYLEAQERTGIKISGITLYCLNHQGFINSENSTLQGKEALTTIKNAITAAQKMGIPTVSVPTKGMFGVAKNAYALQKLAYAVEVAKDCGVVVANSFDTDLKRQLEVIETLGGNLKTDFNTIDPIVNAKENPADMIRTLGSERIKQIKIRDLKADAEGFITTETGTPALIGEGNSNWRECVEAAKEVNFKGWVICDTPYNYLKSEKADCDYVTLAKMDLDTVKKSFA